MIINEETNYIREFWVKLPTAGLYGYLAGSGGGRGLLLIGCYGYLAVSGGGRGLLLIGCYGYLVVSGGGRGLLLIGCYGYLAVSGGGRGLLLIGCYHWTPRAVQMAVMRGWWQAASWDCSAPIYHYSENLK